MANAARAFPARLVKWPSQRHPAKRVRLERTIVLVDALIAPAVRKLNRLGVETAYCCQGDQVVGDSTSSLISVGYLGLARGARFPRSLLAVAQEYGLSLFGPEYLSAYTPDQSLPRIPNEVREKNRLFVRALNKWSTLDEGDR